MLQKDGTVLAAGDRIFGQLNWAYICYVYGKKSFASLNILASVVAIAVYFNHTKVLPVS